MKAKGRSGPSCAWPILLCSSSGSSEASFSDVVHRGGSHSCSVTLSKCGRAGVYRRASKWPQRCGYHWLRNREEPGLCGAVVLSFAWSIILYISPQQSELSQSSLCHTFVQPVFIEHLLHAWCLQEYSSEHGRCGLWPPGAFFSLDAQCPYSGARALRHHAGKSVTATAIASGCVENEDETMGWENFLKKFFFIVK